MAVYDVPAGDISQHDSTLVADVVDSINFVQEVKHVEVLTDGTAAVYFTTDGSVPTVSGGNTYKVPASGNWTSVVVGVSEPAGARVNLVSHGTPVYSVTMVTA